MPRDIAAVEIQLLEGGLDGGNLCARISLSVDFGAGRRRSAHHADNQKKDHASFEPVPFIHVITLPFESVGIV